jgi:hypothetical protein
MGAGWSRLETNTIKPFIAKQGHWIAIAYLVGGGLFISSKLNKKPEQKKLEAPSPAH